jgi:hypothetical protein
MTRSKVGETSTLADLADNKKKFAMYFNSDHTELHVMEDPESVAPMFYSLKRKV